MRERRTGRARKTGFEGITYVWDSLTSSYSDSLACLWCNLQLQWLPDLKVQSRAEACVPTRTEVEETQSTWGVRGSCLASLCTQLPIDERCAWTGATPIRSTWPCFVLQKFDSMCGLSSQMHLLVFPVPCRANSTWEDSKRFLWKYSWHTIY